MTCSRSRLRVAVAVATRTSTTGTLERVDGGAAAGHVPGDGEPGPTA